MDPYLRARLAIVGMCVALGKLEGHLWKLYDLLNDSDLQNDPAECKVVATTE